MRVGVPKEIKRHEYRVGLTPSAVRELTLLRKNVGEPGGEQKYFIYFFQPADVKDMTFMINKYPAAP